MKAIILSVHRTSGLPVLVGSQHNIGPLRFVDSILTEMSHSSPLAEMVKAPKNTIISITPVAHAKLIELRDAEVEKDQLGLRLAILSKPDEDFRYDLVFDEFRKAAFTDEVRTIDGLKIIIAEADIDLLQGAELDHDEAKGLLIRNPNKPRPAKIEGLIQDDEISAQIETIVSTEVNPALAAHGGYVTFAGHDKLGTAYFTMGGGCHGCSMSRQTMLDGVQTMLVEQVPQITKVRDITDHSTGSNPYYS